MNTKAQPQPQTPARRDPYEICREVVDKWKEGRFESASATFEEQVTQVSSRTLSWVSANSVIAGVHDVFSGTKVDGKALHKDDILALGDLLAMRLRAEGYLVTAPRPGPKF